MRAGVDVRVGSSAKLRAQRRDELRCGMKTIYEYGNSDVHYNTAAARPLTVVWPLGAPNDGREFVMIVNNIPPCPPI